MRRASVALAVLFLAACAGSPLRPNASAEVNFWRADFAADRDALVQAIQGWHRCGDDKPACQEALAHVAVRAAILWRIDSPSHPRVVDDRLLPPPRCLEAADQMSTQATTSISRGARAAWDAYENGSPSELGVAQLEIARGQQELDQASRLADAAAC